MAETALGMARTLVGSALGVASSAAKEEASLLIGVQDDIRYALLHMDAPKCMKCIRLLFWREARL
jgi:disease resistance protein RPM1